ncbi:MAG: GTP-binding protein [Candidatus Odinarchaeota archaeon]
MPQRLTLKTILIGDGGVGKTSLVNTYVEKGPFQADYKITIGVEISSKEVKLASGDVAVLSLHDVAGQPRFEAVRPAFYKGTHLALCVYDVTREKSLENLEKIWIPELERSNPISSSGGIPIQKVLIGNKIDLEDLRMIETSEGEEASKRIGCISHIETSAKENTNVNESFTVLVEKYMELYNESLKK